MPPLPQPQEKFNQQFELLEVLGSGGVSTVFKAKELDGDCLIALKILHTAEQNDKEFTERFLQEAKVLRDFNHSGTARLKHFGQSDTGLAYACSEFIAGTSLRQLLQTEGRLPALRALKIARNAADIMETVHKNNILHRDLKTDNLILFAEPAPDSVKIVDFALSYISETDTFMKAGTLTGSPRYLSPEQGGGKACDARADIYSLTVCLYEMLTGEKPFSAATSPLLLYKHLNDPVPQIEKGQIDRFLPAVNELIEKGMAKEPWQRFQSMKELSQALASLSTALENVKPILVVAKSQSEKTAAKKSLLAPVAAVIILAFSALVTTAVFFTKSKEAEAEFDKYKSEHKKKTVAFLEADVRRLERNKSTLAPDPEYWRNLCTRLQELSEAQRDSGNPAEAEKSINEAISLFNNNSACFKDADTIIRLKGQLALIKIQAKDYKVAGEILSQTESQLGQTALASSPQPANKREAALLPARIRLNIHLHKFDLAGRDLTSVFELGHCQEKNLTYLPPAVATARSAWELVRAEPLSDKQDKLGALAFVDLIIDKLLDTDRDMCKGPVETAGNLLVAIPSDTPGLKSLGAHTQALLTRYKELSLHKTPESEKKYHSN